MTLPKYMAYAREDTARLLADGRRLSASLRVGGLGKAGVGERVGRWVLYGGLWTATEQA